MAQKDRSEPMSVEDLVAIWKRVDIQIDEKLKLTFTSIPREDAELLLANLGEDIKKH